ncbi:ABC transporter [Lysinibacillus alkalisoli]|uniref:Transport permease protein n=1 Tax=Lysinibacillus alkalisoli TaxID=1911548 RepID=A0A917LJW1_9BACI|nr:ABC transporter permease [Lysinibacillus alkalisoli]GGG33970.1 ABC transporter [Lysinibacillus alkalisoli]
MTWLALVERHNKIFRRDKLSMFFSLLSVLIMLALYVLFLQKTQLDSFEQQMTITTDVRLLVSEWMIAGLLSISAITTTLGALGIAVRDMEFKVKADFLTAPISRTVLQLSYVINASIVGVFMSLIILIIAEIYLYIQGGLLLPFVVNLQLIGLIILSVFVASAFNVMFVAFIDSLNAFSALSTVLGTVIGFICGIYIPIGVLPEAVQKVIILFPLSHSTVLFRDVLMSQTIDKVFHGLPKEVQTNYESMFGMVYQLGEYSFTPLVSIVILVLCGIVFTSIAIVIMRMKNR